MNVRMFSLFRKTGLFFLLFLLFISVSSAETVLWEDENGRVLLDDSGEITFISADGNEDGSLSSGSDAEPMRLTAPEYPESSEDSEMEPWSEETPLPYSENDFPETTPNPSASSSGFRFTKTVRYGDSGSLVSDIQTRLSELGFYSARVSGGYYDITRKAVRKFQSYNGLTIDGIAGRQTQELLFSDSAVSASEQPLPTASPEPPKYTLMVDITNQITRAYTYDADGNYTILVREMICSTGTRKNPTPLGTTIMPKTRARWGYFPTWGSHAQYLTRIDKANAFHSVLYSSPNEQSLVVSSYDALGTRQSHGCVRLVVSDAKWIYDNCGAGTIITIYESGQYDPEYTMTLRPALDKTTLRERPLPKPTPSPEYTPENWPQKYRTLRRGSRGDDVYMVQMRLNELGYYHGSITGGYYEGTMQAVKAFQKDHGLSVDGLAGPNTQSVLFNAHQPYATEVPVTPMPEMIETPVPTFTPEPDYLPPIFDEAVG